MMGATIVSRMASALQRFDRYVWPSRRVVLTPAMKASLTDVPLVVADVGAASGPEERWNSVISYVRFLTFEPGRPQAEPDSAGLMTNLAIGLSSGKARGVLHIMADQDASTLCQVNHSIVDAFAIAQGLHEVGTTEIDLDTLDSCLERFPKLMPDFLKIDVEGADLEVLRGSQQALRRCILGVRVEVSFLERHSQAPFFGETDEFLRECGFQLFHLSRERWVRRNLVHGFTSDPQLAWGDAVYFLTTERIMQRLASRSTADRLAIISKLIAILLVHGVHDFAVEIIDEAAKRRLLPDNLLEELKGAVLRSVDRSVFYLVKCFGGLLFAMGVFVLAFPLKTARQRATFYVQQRAGHLFRILVRMAGRSGPQKSCISD